MMPGYASEVMLGYTYRCAICRRLIEPKDGCAAVSEEDLEARHDYWAELCNCYGIHPVIIE